MIEVKKFEPRPALKAGEKDPEVKRIVMRQGRILYVEYEDGSKVYS